MMYERLCRRSLLPAVCLAVLISAISSAFAATPLKAGERVVFLGDSITEQRIYTRFMMDYFSLRYPNCDVSFRNAGWGGDTAPKVLDRLQRDVLSLRPNVVTICLGMNDADYGPFKQETFDKYITAYEQIISELKKANVKVVLLTPGCVDEDRRESLKGYNETLGEFADRVVEFAKTHDLPVYNIHDLMLDVQTKAKKDNPNFTMIPDGVHPDDPGHILMAYGLLKALGCTDQPSSLTIKANGGFTIKDGSQFEVRGGAAVVDNKMSFTTRLKALPMYFTPGAREVLKYTPIVEDLSKFEFKVTGLKDGNWKLVVDGIETGVFSSKDLAGGINLTLYPGPWQTLGEKVDNMAWNQEQMYFINWREFQVGSLDDQAKAMLSTSVCPELDQVIEKWEKHRQEVVRDDREWHWELKLEQ